MARSRLSLRGLALTAVILTGLLTTCAPEPAPPPTPAPPPATTPRAPGLGYQLAGYGLEDVMTGGRRGSTELTDLPPGAPGELVSSAEVPAPDGMRAWRMIYHSRGPLDEDRLVTGLVVAPAGTSAIPAGGRRLISFGHGTTGINDSCAPSRAEPPLSAVGGVLPLVRAGNVLAITDYIGLGGPGEHPIYVADTEGRALLDAARAAHSLSDARAGRDVVLWGYSQGGQAALAAGGLAASYAPDLRVHGAAATAPLADLPTSLRLLDRTVPDGVAYVLLAALGLAAADPTIDLNAILTQTGRRLTAVARNQCAVGLLKASQGESTSSVFTADPFTTEPFAAGFARQWQQTRLPGPPELVLQGDLDTVIHRSTTDGVVSGLCASGGPVEYHRYGLADHGTILGVSMADLTSWINARFVGTKPPGDICTRP